MIYKNCIDACFDCVKACDRCSCEGCETSKECLPLQECCILSAEVCNLVGRLTARGICCAELYDICAKICDDCAKECSKVDNEYSKTCAEACKKCAETCRTCSADCAKCATKKQPAIKPINNVPWLIHGTLISFLKLSSNVT